MNQSSATNQSTSQVVPADLPAGFDEWMKGLLSNSPLGARLGTNNISPDEWVNSQEIIAANAVQSAYSPGAQATLLIAPGSSAVAAAPVAELATLAAPLPPLKPQPQPADASDPSVLKIDHTGDIPGGGPASGAIIGGTGGEFTIDHIQTEQGTIQASLSGHNANNIPYSDP